MPAHIGIVDTGVNPQQLSLERTRLTGIGVRRDGETYHFVPDFRDLHGHGTAMALRVQSICPMARIFAIRIAQQDKNGVICRVQERALAMGIEWCVEQGIRIVNVSYNITEAPPTGTLFKACQRADKKGTIIVAAYRSDWNKPVYPAGFPSVIGVRCRNDLRPGQVVVLSEANLDLFASGGSNSIATAQVSAMVGRIHTVDDSLGLKEVFAFLMQVAVQ